MLITKDVHCRIKAMLYGALRPTLKKRSDPAERPHLVRDFALESTQTTRPTQWVRH